MINDDKSSPPLFRAKWIQGSPDEEDDRKVDRKNGRKEGRDAEEDRFFLEEEAA